MSRKSQRTQFVFEVKSNNKQRTKDTCPGETVNLYLRLSGRVGMQCHIYNLHVSERMCVLVREKALKLV